MTVSFSPPFSSSLCFELGTCLKTNICCLLWESTKFYDLKVLVNSKLHTSQHDLPAKRLRAAWAILGEVASRLREGILVPSSAMVGPHLKCCVSTGEGSLKGCGGNSQAGASLRRRRRAEGNGGEWLQKSPGEFDQRIEMSEGRVTRGQSQVAAPAQANQALNFHLCLLIHLELTGEK